MVSSQKQVLNTSLRSETQATDCTCSGCSANSAATSALRHADPVIRDKTPNSSNALATWRNTLTRWCAPARPPHNCQTTMWESQVSGRQLPGGLVVKTQTRPDSVNPPCT